MSPTIHYPRVFVGGSAHAPGLFGWGCSCGAGTRDPNGTLQGWDVAERAAAAHLTEAEENGDQAAWSRL